VRLDPRFRARLVAAATRDCKTESEIVREALEVRLGVSPPSEAAR